MVCGWAKEHVLKYGLCPLAKDGLETGTTRVIPLPDVRFRHQSRAPHALLQMDCDVILRGSLEAIDTLPLP